MMCARCGEMIEGHPATSRVDNKTDICTPCGQLEALWAFKFKGDRPMPPLSEPIVL